MKTPSRGFSLNEFEHRTERAQRLMAAEKIDAMLLTTEPEFRYFSGFHSQFWNSPTRPWFLVVPAKGKPVAVVPTIGASGIAQTWIDEIHTWSAPNPEDDGITLLADVLKNLASHHNRIGLQLGHESHLRMPAGDFLRLRDDLNTIEIIDTTMLIRSLRNIKSEGEIEKIRYVCQLTSDAFEALPESLKIGQTELEACQIMKIDLLERGADGSPYLMGASGTGGYDNIIMGPTARQIERGDVLIIDTGTTFDGYFCDFDRNFTFGEASDAAKRAYETVYKATDAGFAAAKPGATTSHLCAVMWEVLEAGGALGNNVGRMGHGLGMQLTEGPSNMPGDDTILEPGMVLTLEPGMEFAPNQLMVHEENIVIREDGAEMLTRRAPKEMPVII